MTRHDAPTPGRRPGAEGPYGDDVSDQLSVEHPDDGVGDHARTQVETDPAATRQGDTSSSDGRGGRHEAPTTRRGGGRRGGSFARELPFLVLIAFALALLIKAFLIQAFWIPSGSMERTLLINDRVLVNKVVYDFRDVHRGEVVVFNGDGTGFEAAEESQTAVAPPSNIVERGLRDVQSLLGLGAPSNKDFIKRVIGVGGDTVQCCDSAGRVQVNGHSLNEPYLYDNSQPVGLAAPAGRNFGPLKVPKGRLFVMGDHRAESADSRAHGTIPQSKVVGRAFVRIWPPSRVAFLRVPKTFQVTLTNALGSPALLAGLAVAPVAVARRRRGGRRRSAPSGETRVRGVPRVRRVWPGYDARVERHPADDPQTPAVMSQGDEKSNRRSL
jgi:signal peptidase I